MEAGGDETAPADAGEARRAGALVVATGVLWGLYWVPVRAVAGSLLPGAWGSLAIVALACLLLLPLAILGRRRLAAAGARALLPAALGGAAFLLYSVALAYGQVAVVILLFYLTPVWSTLIGRFWLRWPTPPLRYAAIGTGFAGLLLVLGGEGGLPLPRGLGDWLGLASGLLWAIASTGMRTRVRTRPGETLFVFALGALACAALLAPLLEPLPVLRPAAAWWPAAAWILAGALLWWGLPLIGFLWATTRLEPARLGILLMSEVLVGVLSAGLFAGEPLGYGVAVGGALVVAAALLEVWPAGRRRAP